MEAVILLKATYRRLLIATAVGLALSLYLCGKWVALLVTVGTSYVIDPYMLGTLTAYFLAFLIASYPTIRTIQTCIAIRKLGKSETLTDLIVVLDLQQKLWTSISLTLVAILVIYLLVTNI